MKKILYVVLDGVGDLPIPQLNHKTTLQAADIPNLDRLAQAGQSGRMYTVGQGIAPQSDVAVISILGYDPRTYYTGRGPLETFASGLHVNPGDVALRCNFATRGEGREIADRRVGRTLTTEEATVLRKAVNEEVKLMSVPDSSFEYLNTVAQRGVLVLRSKDGLSGEITNVDPAYERYGKLGVAKENFEPFIQEVKPADGFETSQQAINTAKLMNEFIEKSCEVLERHPLNKQRVEKGLLAANLILARDAGQGLPNFPPYTEKFGLNFATFVEMPVEVGIARLMSIHIVELPQPSGNLGADYELRAQMAIDHLPNYDGIYIHIKGPDEPAHDGDYERKVEINELIDKHFFGPLLKKLDMAETIIVITADHATPCVLKSHSDDPVPLVISGGNLTSDGTPDFSESACARGSLGTLQNGTELVPLLIRCAQV